MTTTETDNKGVVNLLTFTDVSLGDGADTLLLDRALRGFTVTVELRIGEGWTVNIPGQVEYIDDDGIKLDELDLIEWSNVSEVRYE